MVRADNIADQQIIDCAGVLRSYLGFELMDRLPRMAGHFAPGLREAMGHSHV